MQKNSTLDIKSILQWVFNAYFAVIGYMAKDIYTDVKEIREQLPAIRTEIDHLKDQELIKKFKNMKATLYMKEEPIITYDLLIKTKTL